MQSKKDKIELIYRFCKSNCSELERWPSYFHRRALEMQSYIDLMPETKEMSILELGCGIGYQSAMLASISKSVVATDLPNESVADHAPGMDAAAKLHKQLAIDIFGKFHDWLTYHTDSNNQVIDDFGQNMDYSIQRLRESVDPTKRVIQPITLNTDGTLRVSIFQQFIVCTHYAHNTLQIRYLDDESEDVLAAEYLW